MTPLSIATHAGAPSVAILSAGVLRWSVVALGVAATIAVVAWFLMVRKHPEDTAGHREEEGLPARKPDGVARRPAGPAAENMSAERPGGSVPPGPWPGSSAVPPEATGAPE